MTPKRPPDNKAAQQVFFSPKQLYSKRKKNPSQKKGMQNNLQNGNIPNCDAEKQMKNEEWKKNKNENEK